jgi:hypothetical protein
MKHRFRGGDSEDNRCVICHKTIQEQPDCTDDPVLILNHYEKWAFDDVLKEYNIAQVIPGNPIKFIFVKKEY